MEYRPFGRTGLDVSRLCLGCMSYGDPARGAHAWTLGEADSRPFLRRALDLGFNFFDTANVYSDGSSGFIATASSHSFPPRLRVLQRRKHFAYPSRLRSPTRGRLPCQYRAPSRRP